MTAKISPKLVNPPIRILALSDTHRTAPHASTSRYAYRQPLPNADILIHAGDLTELGHWNEHLITFNTIASHPASIKLVIPGNHDFTLDEDLFVHREKPSCGIDGAITMDARRRLFQQCAELWTGEQAREHGIVMCLDEGVQEITVKGKKLRIYTTPYTPWFGGWAFAYSRQGDRFNDAAHGSNSVIPSDVDVIVSHGPPHGVLDKVKSYSAGNVGCESLMAAAARVRPLLHIFGHIHEGYGAQRVVWVQRDGSRIGESQIWRGGNADLAWDEDGGQGGEERKLVNYVNLTGNSVELGEGEDLNMVINGPQLRRGEETLFVNAAIMTESSQPWNAPWIIDLEIPG